MRRPPRHGTFSTKPLSPHCSSRNTQIPAWRMPETSVSSHARAETVFVLDADNWIYPTCLRALHRRLCDGDYAAAYQGFCDASPTRPGNRWAWCRSFEWNVRDLVRAPYIDAMALFRRKSVIDVGGYATELIEHGWFGWEDYALWLALAEAGLSGKLVQYVVGAYREHSGSMIHRTNASTEATSAPLRAAFRVAGAPASRP